ncbi:MAG: SDR family oxidoreductase [Rhizobiaceae bacterium]|nr:SDR family oxidoreductase [Rhizobiaceae bacterium]
MKTALITGAAKRIGASIATDLAKDGFNVAIQYASSEDDAQTLASELRDFGVDAVAFEANLLVADECQSLFRQAREALGPINLLVNNASIFVDDTVTEFDEELWDAHFNIHLKAPSILSGEMAKQADIQDGLIINMVDQRVQRLNPNFHSYTLSKSALWTATRTLAQALAPRIRVNAIGPGPTLQNARQEPEDFARQIDGLILKRGPELKEFSDTICHLFESKSITGQLFALDGGQHLAWETPDIVGIPE